MKIPARQLPPATHKAGLPGSPWHPLLPFPLLLGLPFFLAAPPNPPPPRLRFSQKNSLPRASPVGLKGSTQGSRVGFEFHSKQYLASHSQVVGVWRHLECLPAIEVGEVCGGDWSSGLKGKERELRGVGF